MLMCRDLAIVASDYIDGNLGAVDNLSVRMHLLMCRHCRSFIGNLRSSIQLMRGHSDNVLDDRLARRLDREIDKALQSKSKGGPDKD
ncbi:zf-HC2 domain-containing protein [Marinobacter caseinilyticus]|uniref:zf-HC2 domain-containing protein n=1 Tax=Marinobacter caseinilyticus TaxID=2692195 RepID=UPI00140AB0DA|nr:zf-HC2 domain-containing protein [Marinobacter caseinilyticus]